jgi:hypothetical protein
LELFWRRLYPVKTVQNVAGALGAPPRTVEKWLDGTSTLSVRWYLKALSVWGPDFLAASFDDPPDWVDQAAAAAERRRLERELAAIEARLRRAELVEREVRTC